MWEVIAEVFGLNNRLVMLVPSKSVSLPSKRPMNSCLVVSKVEKLLNRKMVSLEQDLMAMRD